MHPGPEIDIEQAEFFCCLGRPQLDSLRPLLHERRFPRQRVLFFERQPAEHLWALRRGEVRLYRSSHDGRITTLEILGPGNVFGALTALELDTYAVSAETLSPVAAWRLPRRAFLKLLAEDPRLSMEIVRIVSGRLREAQRRMLSFAHDRAPTRLAQALLRAARQGEARVTRRALAEVAGTTVETAIRVLRRFERNGIIHGEVGCIQVLDEPALQRIAGEAGG